MGRSEKIKNRWGRKAIFIAQKIAEASVRKSIMSTEVNAQFVQRKIYGKPAIVPYMVTQNGLTIRWAQMSCINNEDS